MSTSDLIRRLGEAGAPPEAIAIAIEAVEQAEQRRKAPARERKRKERASRDIHATVTGQSREVSVTVTGNSRDALPPSLSFPQTPNQTHPPARINNIHARGSRISDDFTIPDDWLEWAIDQGWSRRDATKEGEIFVDYWRGVSGAKAVKLDWLATWRNWIRKNRQSGGRSNGGYGADHSGIPL